MSTNKKTVKTEKKNPLSTPLVVSMCLNAVLFLAVIIMGVYMSGNNNTVDTPAETNAPAETSATETAEPTVYTFETDAGESVEVVAAPDAYILAAEYICAGDGSEWVFHYNEETNASSLVMTMDDVATDFDISFYLTNTENEEDSRLIAELYDEATGAYSLWYLSNVLAEDGETFLGMALQSATAENTNLLLCTPEYYEEYQAQSGTTEE